MFYLDEELEAKTRYDMARFMEWINGDFHEVINSFFILHVQRLSPFGETPVGAAEGKPDLLSYRIYKSTQYWWILMAYNGLIDVEELVADLVVKYPSIDQIEDLYFRLKALERAQVTSI